MNLTNFFSTLKIFFMKMKLCLLFIIFLTISQVSICQPPNPYYPNNYNNPTYLPPGVDLYQHGAWHLIWSDEFDGTSLDNSKWMTHYPCLGGGDGCTGCRNQDGSFSNYLDGNVSVSGGECIIKLLNTPSTVHYADGSYMTWPHTSGVIATYGKDDIAPGTSYNSITFPTPGAYKFEARIRLCGTHNAHDVMWLWSDNGGSEIDMMEWYQTRSTNMTYTLHNNFYPSHPSSGSEDVGHGDWGDGTWHIYGCEWDMNFVTIFIDGIQVWRQSRLTTNPSTNISTPLAAFLNPTNTDGDLRLDLEISNLPMYVDECQMEIDWVRVYQRDQCTDNLVIPVYNLFPFDNLSAKTITCGTNDITRSWNYLPHQYEVKHFTGQAITFLPNYDYKAQFVDMLHPTDPSTGITYDWPDYNYLLVVPSECSAYVSSTDYGCDVHNIVQEGLGIIGYGNDGVVCQYGNITLTDPDPGGTWTTSDYTVASIDPVTGVVTGNSVGSALMTYAIGDCSNSAWVVVNDCTGGKSINTANNKKSLHAQLTIFPNPTQNTITISYPCQSTGQLEIKINNVAGQVVYTESVACTEGNNAQQVVDMSSFAAGVYFVDLTLNDKHVVKKVVKL
jgi:hypothetical protein